MRGITMSEYLTISEAAEYLKVAQITLRRWEKSGKIKPFKTTGGQRRYTKEMLDSVLTGTQTPQRVSQKLAIGYCRVSSNHQKEDLKRQKQVVENYLEKLGQPFKIITDTGSGLNYKRKGLNELIHLVSTNQCDKIIVNYQDRLVRFGFEILESLCREHDVEIIVINQSENVDANQELVDDVLSVITVFSAKLYGKRSHKNAKIIRENKNLFSKDH